MATRTWTGAGQSTAQVNSIVVGGTYADGQVYTVTINSKTVSYTSVSGDTNTTVASSLQSALAACTEGEFTEITWTVSTTTITATANTAGVPFTQTSGATGTGTLVTSTTTANVSPNDFNNPYNWSGNTVPVAGDSIVLEKSDVNLSYNLSQSFTIASLIRRATYTGQVGLPIYNPNGYYEYRGTTLTFTGITSLYVEQPTSDQPAQIKLDGGSGQTTAVIVGTSPASVGNGALWWKGTHASNSLDVASGSIWIAPQQTDTATVATLNATGATVTYGPGTTLTTAKMTDCTSNLYCAVTTLTVDGGSGQTTTWGTVAATTVTVDNGTFIPNSSGTITTLTIGTNATVDYSQDRRAKVVTNPINMYPGSTLNDPNSVLATAGYSIVPVRCTLSELGSLNIGVNRTIAVT